MAKKATIKKDVYTLVNERILKDLESGFIPWEKPWFGSSSTYNFKSGKPYSMINTLILGKPGRWGTFKQWEAKGGKIKKGAKSSQVVYWNIVQTKDEKDPESKKAIPVLRYFNVFHEDDVEGVEFKEDESKVKYDIETVDEEIENLLGLYYERENIRVYDNVEEDKAYYSPLNHSITLPMRSQFKGKEAYYSTKFHETCHSTGKTLGRDLKNSFGTKGYAREELIAEIGSSYLMNHFGMDIEKTRQNTAAYIQSWIQAIKEDSRAVITAAGRAEKAVNLILGAE